MEVEQKLITATEELSHVTEMMVEVQRKTREYVKEEFEGKMMEMQAQAQLQEQMMQMIQRFQK